MIRPLENDWWNTVWTHSNGFTQEKLFLNIFGNETVSQKDFMDTLRSVQTIPAEVVDQLEDPPTRVYVEKGLRLDYESIVRHNPPTLDENLETWSQRIFGSQKFGLVINNCELLNNQLAQRLAAVYYPRIKNMPMCEVDLVFFAGNYGFTPFGIHKDGSSTSILHFHVGPHQKEFYCWDPDTFKNLTGSSESCFDPETFCRHNERYQFESGSIFVMPSHVYHIANNPDLSVTLTLGFSFLSEEEVVLKALATSGKNLIKNSLPSSKSVMIERPTCSVNQWIEDIVSDYKLSVESNCRFPFASKKVEQRIPATVDIVMVNAPFEIQHRLGANGVLHVYVRGHHIILSHNPALISLIKIMNSRISIHLSEFKEYVGDTISHSELLQFLNNLYEYDGIIIAQNH